MFVTIYHLVEKNVKRLRTIKAMEVGVLEKKKYSMRFTLKGEGHTLCNLLRDGLWSQKGIKIAAYTVSHPLIGIPEVIVESNVTDVNKVLQGALKDLKTQNKNFLTAFKKGVK